MLDNQWGFLLWLEEKPNVPEGSSMRKIKEVLRLRYDLGLLQNEIARSCSIGQASVHRYLERATAGLHCVHDGAEARFFGRVM